MAAYTHHNWPIERRAPPSQAKSYLPGYNAMSRQFASHLYFQACKKKVPKRSKASASKHCSKQQTLLKMRVFGVFRMLICMDLHTQNQCILLWTFLVHCWFCIIKNIDRKGYELALQIIPTEIFEYFYTRRISVFIPQVKFDTWRNILFCLEWRHISESILRVYWAAHHKFDSW